MVSQFRHNEVSVAIHQLANNYTQLNSTSFEVNKSCLVINNLIQKQETNFFIFITNNSQLQFQKTGQELHVEKAFSSFH